MRKIWVILLLCVGCSPQSQDDFIHAGESVCRALVEELQEIETRQDLLKRAPHLNQLFEELVDLMISARKAQAEEAFDPRSEGSPIAEVLQAELKRIYQIEGGRELIEKAQKEPLLRLDAFERSLK